jgi:hypothetical protein
MQEIWKPVVGYAAFYEVSDQGRVRSLDRTTRTHYKSGLVSRHFYAGRNLKPGLSSNGYRTVSLNRRGKRASFCVQYLVLAAFVGPRKKAEVIRHLDGVRENNQLSNLAWGTAKENAADALRHGTRLQGEDYLTAKLTNMAARTIRRLHYVVPQSELAKIFNVSPAAIQAVHDGRTWTHV